MANQAIHSESDPGHHTRKIREELTGLVDHLRSDVGKVGDPKAQALFETAAEVLKGLQTAFEHFENRSEPAWNKAN